MEINEIRNIFVLATLGLAFLAVLPTLVMVVPEVGSESFSELWLLDTENKTNYYPFNIDADEVNTVLVGVGNHVGNTQYYLVKLKIRNTTQSLPDLNSSQPSVLSSLYEYHFFVGADEAKQFLVYFELSGVSVSENTLYVDYVIIDDISFPVITSARHDSEDDGYYFQLFFELWRYDLELNRFVFDNRFVGFWIKVNGTQ